MIPKMIILITTLFLSVVFGDNYTRIHAPGYCAMFRECGTSSGGNLNCPYNGPAIDPGTFQNPIQFRTTLTNFCGPKFANLERTCCDQDILDTMIESIAISEQFVGGCPACWYNMKAIWCEQSCSPDQSVYYNISLIGPDPGNSGNMVVLETEYYVSEAFGTSFYDSCAETKYGASNTLAMTFIGGGAKNYQEMLDYMGEPKFLGTPFKISFPVKSSDPTIIPMNSPTKSCSGDGGPDNGTYRCACVDCSASCPVLEEPPAEKEICMVGTIRCLSFGLLIAYGVLIVLAVFLFIWCKPSQDQFYPIDKANHREWVVYSALQKGYYNLGLFVGRHPLLVLFIGAVLVAACCVGLMNFQIETDPINLWVGPESASNQDKKFFDESFGPFYRTQQIIISRRDGASIIEKDVVSILFDIETGVNQVKITYNETEMGLFEFCFRPLGVECVVQSVTGYWQGNKTSFDNDPDWRKHFLNCVANPSFPGDDQELECLPSFEDPLKPEIVLGGFPDKLYDQATALVSTYVIQNSLDESYLEAVFDWEYEFVEYMKEIEKKYPLYRITFYSESGIEVELARESTSDLVIVALSYLVMFLYASLALGKFISIKRFFIDSKFTLGIAGVLICVFSVLVSVGLFSAFGVKTSLIIAEVIPFLVLAVGVDNIFILVHCFGRFDSSLPSEERAAMALSEVGPSITLCALSETIAFALGGIVPMPAVYNFAGFSAVAVFVDFLLQITCFVALLTLDSKRVESNRLDCIPCVQLDVEQPRVYEEGFLDNLVSQYFAPFIVNPIVKLFTIFFFVGLLVVAIAAIPRVELGLDQKIALPQDSYLIPYFEDQTSLLKVGVPMYFVISGVNVSTYEGQKTMCSSFRDCDPYSIGNLIVLESNRPEYSKIALSPALWLDDFIRFLNPSLAQCCRVKPVGLSCARLSENFCQIDDPGSDDCCPCYKRAEYQEFEIGPVGDSFMKHLKYFLGARPGANCALAGQAAYSTAVVPDYTEKTVTASHFRTYHTVLTTQKDFIDAYDSALRICSDIENRHPQVDCFPYAITYVYFEQYRTIVPISVFLVIIAAVAIFLVNWIILGSFMAALCVVIPVLMIVIDLAGIMALWKISLNAVSLVNLVMGLGISVEFCSHLTRAFRISSGTKDERTIAALKSIGASIFSGITVTKFFGVVVLAFANSEIFVVYYFRIYLSIVFLGFGHGLIFLPVLLSYIGPTSVRAVHYDSHNINASRSGLQNDDEKKELKKQDQRNTIYGSMD